MIPRLSSWNCCCCRRHCYSQWRATKWPVRVTPRRVSRTRITNQLERHRQGRRMLGILLVFFVGFADSFTNIHTDTHTDTYTDMSKPSFHAISPTHGVSFSLTQPVLAGILVALANVGTTEDLIQSEQLLQQRQSLIVGDFTAAVKQWS